MQWFVFDRKKTVIHRSLHPSSYLSPSVLYHNIFWNPHSDNGNNSLHGWRVRNVCLSRGILTNSNPHQGFSLSRKYLKVCYLSIPPDGSIAAFSHLLKSPSSGLGSSCQSHIERSHGEPFWQLLTCHLSSPVFSSAIGGPCQTEKWSMLSVTNTVRLCCGIIGHLRLGFLLSSVWNAADPPEEPTWGA